ncbi:DUF4442 domain-containing protein [Neisseria leonii]|uniref:DUF4442 domain-containing protein n=1 Tax=Neisseria leonii TaxID=2995413 RepID=A0A9X4E651_9NEIS|nr:DUF4442 domain-containing protein [Neisseria sp. 51.81]MDD9328112.1 DUF4442 domain-containing protein [Neisseria sp. 51.81]
MRTENRITRQLAALSHLDEAERAAAQTAAMNQLVPFLNTVGTRFDVLRQDEVRVSVDNRPQVQNHIQSVHACVTALLAETATGFVTMLNTPDDKLIVCKSMNIRYTRRSSGNLYAVAKLSEARAAVIAAEERGNMTVPCRVYDEDGEQPVEIEMTWAWLPRG